jgi:hypothetical protein
MNTPNVEILPREKWHPSAIKRIDKKFQFAVVNKKQHYDICVTDINVATLVAKEIDRHEQSMTSLVDLFDVTTATPHRINL